MKAVIELLRVSTEAQAGEDKAGLAAQRAANRRTAANSDSRSSIQSNWLT